MEEKKEERKKENREGRSEGSGRVRRLKGRAVGIDVFVVCHWATS